MSPKDFRELWTTVSDLEQFVGPESFNRHLPISLEDALVTIRTINTFKADMDGDGDREKFLASCEVAYCLAYQFLMPCVLPVLVRLQNLAKEASYLSVSDHKNTMKIIDSPMSALYWGFHLPAETRPSDVDKGCLVHAIQLLSALKSEAF